MAESLSMCLNPQNRRYMCKTQCIWQGIPCICSKGQALFAIRDSNGREINCSETVAWRQLQSLDNAV